MNTLWQVPSFDAGFALGAGFQPSLMAPGLLVALAIVAAVGVIILLPSKRETPMRKIGGIVLLAVGIIFAVQLARNAAGMGAYFWIFSAIALISAVRVVTHTKPVYSALYFVMTVMASAGLFVLMWAEFMAAALVLIYAGAILVTYVFVIMLASEAAPDGASIRQQVSDHDATSREPVACSAVGFALLGLVLFVVFDRAGEVPKTPETIAVKSESNFKPVGQTQKLGEYLFRKQLLNLELAGLILTVAMVGAIVIARKRVINPQLEAERLASGEVMVAPMTPIDDNPHSIPVIGTENPRQKEYPET